VWMLRQIVRRIRRHLVGIRGVNRGGRRRSRGLDSWDTSECVWMTCLWPGRRQLCIPKYCYGLQYDRSCAFRIHEKAEHPKSSQLHPLTSVRASLVVYKYPNPTPLFHSFVTHPPFCLFRRREKTAYKQRPWCAPPCASLYTKRYNPYSNVRLRVLSLKDANTFTIYPGFLGFQNPMVSPFMPVGGSSRKE
jgi:hypothetical protein